MAKFITSLLIVHLVFAGTLARSHGGGEHVLGTVAVIDGSHIEVKTPKGGTVSVRVTDKTQYRAKGEAGAAGRPQVGDRVVIETEKDGEALTATEVRFARQRGK